MSLCLLASMVRTTKTKNKNLTRPKLVLLVDVADKGFHHGLSKYTRYLV